MSMAYVTNAPDTSTMSGWKTNYTDWSRWSDAVSDSLQREESSAKKWQQVLASRKAAALLVRQYAERLKPFLLVFRRFDWRSAPRWSSLRWRSLT